MKNRILLLFTISVLVTLTGCFPGGASNSATQPAGFFSGVWHGWIAPISLIVGIFNHSVRIYEVNNTGWWYDLGYYMAVIAGFGGIALSRRKKKSES
ncbi:MAG TPA: hypothetical protein VL633_13435 [Bacteroidota bacterium]|nr:hypothetical protein [Bacteroidota bacterium]